MAIGSAWLALPVEKGASLGIYCEDSRDELWRRQADINTEYESGLLLRSAMSTGFPASDRTIS